MSEPKTAESTAAAEWIETETQKAERRRIVLASPEYPDNERARGWYGAARRFGACLFHTLVPAKIHHLERFTGIQPPFIVICNHQSALDPILVAYPMKKHEIWFLAKKELIRGKLARTVLAHLHMIPIDRGNADMEAVRACMKVIKGGKILGIFPEGTRFSGGKMEVLESGTSMIALRSGVPLIPLFIDPKPKLFRRVNLYCWDPIPTEDLRAQGVNRETCEALNRRITETYAGKMSRPGD